VERTRELQLILGVLVLFLLLAAPLAYRAADVSAESLIYPASLASTLLFAIQVWSWRRSSGSLFDPYMIFLIAAILFNGSRTILEVFQLNRTGLLGPGFSPATTLSTIYLVAFGLWSYHLGGMLSRVFVGKRSPATPRPINIAISCRVGWWLIAISALPMLFLLSQAVTAVLAYGYFVALFQRGAPTSLSAAPQILATFLIPGTFLVAASSRRKRSHLWVTVAFTAVYASVQLFLGSRALAVTVLIPYLWLWHRSIAPIPKILLIGGVGLGVLILPLIAAGRAVTGTDRYSPDVLLQEVNSVDNPVINLLTEMGSTAVTIAHTLDLVPAARPFDCGASYAYAALTLLPNAAFDIHPTISHGTPNTWLVRTVNPWTAAQGGSLGYSFLAEAYLNAGWIGVCLIPGLIGYALAWLTAWTINPGDLARLACAAAILAFSLKYARSDASEIVRNIVWYGIGPFGVVRALSKRGLHRKAPRPCQELEKGGHYGSLSQHRSY
jgi:oligosaccharide repeat unit polymerase